MDWGAFIVKQRYEWVEILSKIFGGDVEVTEKACSNGLVCSMCNKQCPARVAASTTLQ